jgi:hypothetical protein
MYWHAMLLLMADRMAWQGPTNRTIWSLGYDQSIATAERSLELRRADTFGR